jgi:hypothetical protein
MRLSEYRVPKSMVPDEALVSKLEEGIREARRGGFGIYHLDLLVLRARVRLLQGDAGAAERDARTALFGLAEPPSGGSPYDAPALDETAPPERRGIFPSPESGWPKLLAATHLECGYAWGEGDARQALAEALLLRAAQSLGRPDFVPARFDQLPADARALIDRARDQLTLCCALRERIRDPKREETERTLRRLEGGVLTEYDWEQPTFIQTGKEHYPQPKISSIEFTIDSPLGSFNKEEFMATLRDFIGSDISKIRIASIRPGSTMVTIEGDSETLSSIVEELQSPLRALHKSMREKGVTLITYTIEGRRYTICLQYKYSAFISYRHGDPDQNFARQLLQDLEAAGYKVAIDERDFSPSATFLEEMERCVKESRFTLAVISPRYFQSGNTQEEAIIRKVLDMGERKRRLVPLTIEKVEKPVWLYDIVGIDFTVTDPLVSPLERLKRTLEGP